MPEEMHLIPDTETSARLKEFREVLILGVSIVCRETG